MGRTCRIYRVALAELDFFSLMDVIINRHYSKICCISRPCGPFTAFWQPTMAGEFSGHLLTWSVSSQPPRCMSVCKESHRVFILDIPSGKRRTNLGRKSPKVNLKKTTLKEVLSVYEYTHFLKLIINISEFSRRAYFSMLKH